MKDKNISYLYKIPSKFGIHHYTVNASPLASQPLARIPTRKIRPDGWIREVLCLMADGLTGHLAKPVILGLRLTDGFSLNVWKQTYGG